MEETEFSQEYVDKYMAQMKADTIEYYRLDKLVKDYKRRIKNKDFNISIVWQTKILQIDLCDLQTGISDDIKNRFPEEFVIIDLDLEWVVKMNCANPEKIYSKRNLWNVRNPNSVARLIETVERGVKLFPPMIRPVKYNQISIMDGHHRIALARYLNLRIIPFLVEREYEELLMEYLENIHF